MYFTCNGLGCSDSMWFKRVSNFGRQAGFQKYIYTLSKHQLHFAHLNFDKDFIFRRENASIYTSKATKEAFDEWDCKSWTGQFALRI